MDKAKINLFDGAVSHRRVGNKKHQFEYKYKSAFVEDVFDFNLEKFKCINSKILSFTDNSVSYTHLTLPTICSV